VMRAAAEHSVPVLRPVTSGSFGPQFYRDGFHLNDAGAALFTDRLIAALEALRPRQLPAAPAPTLSDIAHKLMLTLPEAAALSNLSRNHLRQAIKTGRLKAQKIGRGWRIKRADLDAYVSAL